MREFWKIIRLSFVIFITSLVIISSAIYGLSTATSLIWQVVITLYNLISKLLSALSWLLYEIFIVHPHLITIVVPILLIIAFIIIFWKEINTKTIIIEPFEVPDELSKSGYTGKAVANQLLDRLNLIQKEVENHSKAALFIKNNLSMFTTFPIILEYEKIEIPGTGLNFNSIINFIRQIIKKEPVVLKGELLINESNSILLKNKITLSVRVSDYPAYNIANTLERFHDTLLEIAQQVHKKISPNTIALYQLLKNNRGEALDMLDAVVNNKFDKSERATAYHIWGYILMMEEGDYEEAIKKYELSEKLNQKDSGLYHDWALALLSLGRYKESLIKVEKSIKLKKNNYLAFINKGVILALLGHRYDAIQEIEYSIKLNSSCSNAYSNLAPILIDLGQYNEAIEKLKIALELDPNNDKAYYSWGHALLSRYHKTRLPKFLDDIPQAIEKLEISISKNQTNVAAFWVLGMCYLEIEEIEKAKQEFNRFLELNSDPNSELIEITNTYLNLLEQQLLPHQPEPVIEEYP